MIQHIISLSVIALVYVCLFILIFSPTIYAFWFFVIASKVRIKKRNVLRVALLTFCINAVVAYFLFHLAFDYFLIAKVAERDTLAGQSLEKVLAAETAFFRVHGTYYAVGPVRGPYRDEHGFTVPKDVVLVVEPRWDHGKEMEKLEGYAIHVWGKNLMRGTEDEKVKPVPKESAAFTRMRKKLMRSVR